MTTRKEDRYLIEVSNVEKFIKEIGFLFSQKKFPDNYNHTLYFNNPEHEVPFEISIKGRRYASNPFSGKLNLGENWIFEIKKDLINKNSRLREKQRKIITLDEILGELRTTGRITGFPITSPLIPHVSDSYRRSHYVADGDENFRITIDDNFVYHYFEEGLEGREIGREDCAKIELKIPPHKIDSEEVHKIKDLLNRLNAKPTISKKDTAYNLLCRYLRNKSGREVPLSDTEIEAKLLLDREHQYVFHEIKDDFKNGSIGGFFIPEFFPWTLESGKLHLYVINSQKDCLRISIKGRDRKITSKENAEIVQDSFGLGCIIKRKENKEPFSEEIFSSPLKTLYRKRKYFIAEDEDTKRSYCILIDRCTYDSHELYQMEIEGLLNSPSRSEEKEVIEDIAYLTRELIQRHPVLKPTPLTKLKWLKSIL